MNRANRQRQMNYNRGFVSGGIYNANARQQQPWKQQQQQEQQQQQQQQFLFQQQEQQEQVVDEQNPNYNENQQTLNASENSNALLQLQQQQPEAIEIENQDDEDDIKMIVDQLSVDENNFENGKVPFKKIFQTRKKSSERAREKKIRQNRQLRKAILPKNALMALNELKGVVISDFNINSNVGGGFTAVVTVNDKPYEGRGSSKMSAKSSACEKALRDFIIAKMVAKNRKKFAQNLAQNACASGVGNSNGSTGTTAVVATAEGASQTSGGDGGCDGIEQIDMIDDTTQGEYENPEDEVPMINLASFALYKLFTEWEKEGFLVPEMHPQPQQNSGSDNGSVNGGAATPTPKEPKKAPIRSELPPNWETMHPATLLCMMRPGISYVDCGVVGEKPNVLQRLGVTVDEQEFIAQGRSKKIARRNVAVQVCNTLFGTNFAVDEV